MSDYCIEKESKKFSVMILEVHRFLVEQRMFELASQIVRSGTSIGANVQEAQEAYSRKDFAYKMNIALKEAKETRYRLEILFAGGYLKDYVNYKSVYAKCREIVFVLIKIYNSTRKS